MDDPKDILRRFWDQCVRLREDYDLFGALFMSGPGRTILLQQTAPGFFHNIHRSLRDSIVLQFCRVTERGKRGKLTTNSLLHMIPWPPAIRQQLEAVNARLMKFRQYVEPARNKRVAHAELRAELDQVTLGKYPTGDDDQFMRDLEEFLTLAHEHLVGTPVSLSVSTSRDVQALVRVLVKSQLFDRCECTAEKRMSAMQEFEKVN